MWRRYIIAVLIIFSLALQSFKYYTVLAEFYLNRDSIAKNLCVNRNKPQLHCKGKCQLKKQLQKEEQQQQNDNHTNYKVTGPVLFCNEIEEFCCPCYLPVKNYCFYNPALLASFEPSLLRPPCIS